MSTFWYTILGLLFMAYFALGGLDQGVALLLPLHRGDRARRETLNKVGPMFLGNEVWIVGAIGVLVAAFPTLEKELFEAAYPVFVAIVLGLVGLSAGVQLRSRGVRQSAGRGLFDPLITGSALVLAVGWGLVLGVMLYGVPASLLSPAVWSVAAANVALVVTHGAAFLDMRRIRRRVAPIAAVLVLIQPLVWYVQSPPGIRNPWLATALTAVIAAAAVTRRGTFVACALTVVAVALARYPGVLASTVDPGATVTVDSAPAGEDTLRLLALGAAPLLPVLAAAQISCWWLFRWRHRQPTPLYW